MAAVVYVVFAALSLHFVELAPPLRVVVGLPLALFVPGYVLVAAAYPGRHRDPDGTASTGPFASRTGIRPVERMVLSIGASTALVPLVGGATWAAFDEFTRSLVLASLAGAVLLVLPVAVVRRHRLPVQQQFTVRPWARIHAFRSWISGSSTATTTTNVLLVCSVIVALGAFTYAFTVQVQGESYTTAALLSEDGEQLAAEDYPSEFVVNESRPVTLLMSNHEGTSVTYSVVVALERVDGNGTELAVRQRSELGRTELTLQSGERVTHQFDVQPTMTGENLRLSYYVYKGDAPTTPSDSSAYRDLHLWVNVTEST